MADLAPYKVPSLSELFVDDLDEAYKNETLNLLLNQQPRAAWVKVNKFANNSNYLPIDKVEYLLKKIFQQYRIEITGQGTSFNGVWVTVRVHYLHPISGEWQFHDGIGAEALQVKSGSSPAEMQNINTAALAMAFPKAKSSAIKDACHHFGKLFGADLNRKDTVGFEADQNIISKQEQQANELAELVTLYGLKKEDCTEFEQQWIENIIAKELTKDYKKVRAALAEK